MTGFSRAILLASVFWALTACGAPPAPAPAAPVNPALPRDSLARIVDRYWDERVTSGNPLSAQFLADSLAVERRYLEQILAVPRGSLDADSKLTYDIFRRQRELGVDVRLSTETTAVRRDDAGVTITTGDGEITAAEVLVATGRRPRSGDIGLEVAGLEPGRSIEVDDTMRVPGVDWLYAVGDVNGRVERVGGDFFKQAVPAADLYLLKHILHDWDDARCVKILGAIRAAMPAGARLFVVELVVPETPGPDFSKLLDLNMLVMTPGGKERTRGEWEALFGSAGFSSRESTRPSLANSTTP